MKVQKIETPEMFAAVILDIKQMWRWHWAVDTKDVDGIARSVDPDQTATQGAARSGSTLFTTVCPKSWDICCEKYLDFDFLLQSLFFATNVCNYFNNTIKNNFAVNDSLIFKETCCEDAYYTYSVAFAM